MKKLFTILCISSGVTIVFVTIFYNYCYDKYNILEMIQKYYELYIIAFGFFVLGILANEYNNREK